MTEERIRSFDDLKTNVISAGICGKCGGCVSVCSANMIRALKLDENGFPTYAEKDKCLECGLCYIICPQTHCVRDEVRARFKWEPPIGSYSDVISAQSTDRQILDVATDGGVVTALLVHMLESGFIDGAVVSKSRDGFSREPIVAVSREELISAAGSHFGELPHLEELGDRYTNYVSVVRYATRAAPRKLNRLAVVGTPCQITAIRNMQALAMMPSDIMTFTIGLFCMQCFDLRKLLEKDFLSRRNISLDDILGMNIKDEFILTLHSGINVRIPMREIEEIARPACLKCQDFSNDFADISVGGLGSPDKHTTVMIRTIKGKMMMADALAGGVIRKTGEGSSEKAGPGYREMVSLVKEFAERKKARGARYRSTLVGEND